MPFLELLNCAIFLTDNQEEEEVLQCDAPLAAAYVTAFLGTDKAAEIPLPRSEPYGGAASAQLLINMNSEGMSHNRKATAVFRNAYTTHDYIRGPAILLFGAAQWQRIQS